MTDVHAPSPPSDAVVVTGAGSTLSASMLFYAFAHRVAPAAGALDRAKPVPCAGPDVKVKQDALARTMVHAAFWDLERRGVIRLEDVEKKVLFVKTTSIKVRTAPDAELSREIPDSLEYDILHAALAQRGDGDVRGVIRGIYSGDAEDPYRRAIAMANVAQIASGLVRLEVEERHGVGKVLGNKERLIWQCDQVAAHQPDFNATVADWNRDHDADHVRFERLSTEIDRAIESRRKRERESIFDDD